MESLLTIFWPVLAFLISAFVMSLIWFIRLESKVLTGEKEINRVENSVDDLRLKYETKIDNLTTSMNEIRVLLAEIKGSLSRSENNKGE